MKQIIKITKEEAELIEDLLNLDGDKIYQKYGYKRDETITHLLILETELKQILNW